MRSKKERILELEEFTKKWAFLANHVSFSANGTKIIEDITFNIDFGDTFVIMGPSGSGKTILLKLLFALIYPDDGELFIQGYDTKYASEDDIMEIQKDMEFIFQFGSLINNMNVYENIALMNRYHHVKNDEELEQEIESKLKDFNLLERKFARPSDLTLSEKKSVAFCRMLINDFKTIFLDEPFEAIDEATQRKILSNIKNFKKKKKTLVITTNELKFANRYADKIGLLDNGKMVFFGTVNDLTKSQDKKVIRLVDRLSDIADDQTEIPEELNGI